MFVYVRSWTNKFPKLAPVTMRLIVGMKKRFATHAEEKVVPSALTCKRSTCVFPSSFRRNSILFPIYILYLFKNVGGVFFSHSISSMSDGLSVLMVLMLLANQTNIGIGVYWP